METLKYGHNLRVGLSESISRKITKEDVLSFADISGDHNPIHIDEIEAQKTMFGRPIVHGMLCGSMISTVIGMKMPGPGSIYLKQEMIFLAPVYIGDEVTAKVTVEELLPKGKVKLKTEVINQDGQLVIDGYAKVKLPIS